MAQYRLSVYVAKRGDGRAATAMAAYRAAEKIHDQRTGLTIDYSRKQGVLFSEIIAPDNAPDWARDRQQLWNRSEAKEKRQDAHVAREIQLSLPCELNDAQRQELTTEFSRFIAERYNVAVDTAIHAPNREGDERNFHAHLLICGRPFDETKEQGLGNKIREFDAISCQKAKTENHVELWRAKWEQQMNDALERAEVRTEDGAIVKVDHRSYERQGIEQEPTIKEGTAATAKERRGEETERRQINDDIRQRNEERAQLAAEIRADAQELDLLVRRQAELMAAREIHNAITPSDDPTETLTARNARHFIAPEAQTEQTAANDNEEENFGLERAIWEDEGQFQERVQRAVEHAKEREQEQQKPDAPARYRQMNWETAQEFRERVERAERRAERKEQPPRARLTLEYTP